MDHPFDRPIVLSIGGHDPSGGAGLNADLKTFEQFRVYGLSVCSALTVQNDDQFEAIEWTNPQLIIDQIDILARKFQPVTAKIGIVENLDVLEQAVNRLKHHWPKLKIVWDPVLKASAGFVFHETQPKDNINGIMEQLYIVTPNEQEYQAWFADWNHHKPAIYRKGGHQDGPQAIDRILIGKTAIELSAERLPVHKHGSGCVLSAALCSALAEGLDLTAACMRARAYTRTFLTSNESLLGYHAYAEKTS